MIQRYLSLPNLAAAKRFVREALWESPLINHPVSLLHTHTQSTLDLYLWRVYFAKHLLLLRIIDLRDLSRLRSANDEAG